MSALVFLLGLLGVSPDLHALLHAGSAGPDAGCVVTYFRDGGTTEPVSEVQVVRTEAVVGADVMERISVVVVAPRYLRHPERGPPAA